MQDQLVVPFGIVDITIFCLAFVVLHMLLAQLENY